MILSDLLYTDLDFSSLSAEKINDLVTTIEAGYQATYDRIAALTDDQMSFATVIQPMINLDIWVMKASSLCTFPMQVHVDKAVRDASEAAQKKLEEIVIACNSREDVYNAIKNYESNCYLLEKDKLHTEEIKFINDLLRDYKRSGLSVTDEHKRKRIAEIKTKIAELSVTFNKNYNEVGTKLSFTKADLAGLPDDWFNGKTPNNNGYYEVSIKYTDYFPVMDNADNRDTRRKMYHAYTSQCMEVNLPILREVLVLRHELAQLLGYASAADYALELRMAKNAHVVDKFLTDMNDRFTELLDQNLSDVTAFARNFENNPALLLEISDMRYYLRLREEAVCQMNMDDIKQYFPLEKVVKGTLAVYEELLGLKFVEVSNKSAWHSDVKYYLVYDTGTGNSIGSFYLDLHPRDGKYAHAAVFDLAVSCDISSITKIENDRINPVAAMVCNFPQNTNMPFDEVVTFFHEFGHVMHVLCGKTKLPSYSSFKTETDFIEAPSQMLENWCYEASVLSQISEHPETHQPLPLSMTNKLKERQKLHAGFNNKRQLVFGMMDFLLHTLSLDEIKNVDFVEFANRVQTRILKMPQPATACLLASFTHLAGGYESGYYGYLMSLTYASDMYSSQFKANPLSKTKGKRYRAVVLEPGATKSGLELIEDFLERKPTIDAFLDACGLKKPKLADQSLFSSASSRTTIKEESSDDEAIAEVLFGKGS